MKNFKHLITASICIFAAFTSIILEAFLSKPACNLCLSERYLFFIISLSIFSDYLYKKEIFRKLIIFFTTILQIIASYHVSIAFVRIFQKYNLIKSSFYPKFCKINGNFYEKTLSCADDNILLILPIFITSSLIIYFFSKKERHSK